MNKKQFDKLEKQLIERGYKKYVYLDYIREDSTLTKFQKNCLKEKVIGYVNWLKSLKERLKGE